MIREAFRYLLAPKRYALYVHCRDCGQRLDTKFITTPEAKEFLKLWNNYHDHAKEDNE